MIALVTGASSGIGRDIARELSKRKYNIIAVARNEEALKKVKTELEEEYKINVDVRAMDLIDRDGCRKLHEDIKKQYGTIDVLINNAGFGTCGKFTQTDLDKEFFVILLKNEKSNKKWKNMEKSIDSLYKNMLYY